MICDKQMTISWYVDDPKVYRSEKDTVDAFIEWTKETYEDVAKLNPSGYKVYYYLAMTMYNTKSVEMKIYVK